VRASVAKRRPFRGTSIQDPEAKLNAPIEGSNVLKFNDPGIEHRSLAVYDAFIERDKR